LIPELEAWRIPKQIWVRWQTKKNPEDVSLPEIQRRITSSKYTDVSEVSTAYITTMRAVSTFKMSVTSKLHEVISQKAVIFTHAAVRT
jgi:hypothetical protein